MRFVERAWPVRQFPTAVWAGKDPILIGRVGTLRSPVPQDLGQPQIEWNRFARGLRLAIANLLHHDRANNMDHHLLKIDVAPLEAEQLADAKARKNPNEDHRTRGFLQDSKQCGDLLDG